MNVRIFQPAKNAMQSGRANTSRWMMEFEQTQARSIEPLMGWTSSDDTTQQLRLWFDSAEEAIAYAEDKGWMYSVIRAQSRKFQPKAYADNFSPDRLLRWTH